MRSCLEGSSRQSSGCSDPSIDLGLLLLKEAYQRNVFVFVLRKRENGVLLQCYLVLDSLEVDDVFITYNKILAFAIHKNLLCWQL